MNQRKMKQKEKKRLRKLVEYALKKLLQQEEMKFPRNNLFGFPDPVPRSAWKRINQGR